MKSIKCKKTLDSIEDILKKIENDKQTIINKILMELVEEANAEAGIFWYLAKDGLIYAISTYKEVELSKLVLVAEEGMVGNVIKTGKFQIIDNYQESSNKETGNWFIKSKINSIACVPINTNSKATGCFQLINRKRESLFKVDLYLIQTFIEEIIDLFKENNESLELILERISKEVIATSYSDSHNNIRLIAKTFGNFEIFGFGSPLKFKYEKAKELLAILIDKRGKTLSNKEIISIMWEDNNNHQSYLRTIKKDLKDTLKTVHAENAVVCQRDKTSLFPNIIKCDYFDYLDGGDSAINLYKGEYMNQYVWAKQTNEFLRQRKH